MHDNCFDIENSSCGNAANYTFVSGPFILCPHFSYYICKQSQDYIAPCHCDISPRIIRIGLPTYTNNNMTVSQTGVMVPQIDEDGFYKPLQCHASTGYCWCVDRNGIEIPDTNTQGTIDCGKRILNLLNRP